jgi:hypothetical protein
MSESSVRTQANHLASDLDDVAKTLGQALQEVAPLESSIAMLESMLGDVGSPLAAALGSLKEVALLRDQADDAAQARAQSLLDDVIRIVSGAQEKLLAAERSHQAALKNACKLSDVVGSGTNGCAEAMGKAAGEVSGLYEKAKSGHVTLKKTMGPRNESVALAGKIRKRTKTAEEAVGHACGSVATACDAIGEFKGAVGSLEIPPSVPLETALPQLQAFDMASSDQLPDISELEQLAAQARKSHEAVGDLPAAKDIDANISSAKTEISKASSALRAV